MTPTMTALAHAPEQEELNRLAISGIIEAIGKNPEVLMKLKMQRPVRRRSDGTIKLSGKVNRPHVHSKPGIVTKMAGRCADAMHREEGRTMRLRQLRTRGADPVLTTKNDEAQRARLLRGSYYAAMLS